MRLKRITLSVVLIFGNFCAWLNAQPPVVNLAPQPSSTLAEVNDTLVAQQTLTVAQSPGELTLEQLQSMALANNPSIQRAAALVQAARGKAYQVGLQPNPLVGLDFQQLASGGRAEQYGVLMGQTIVRPEKLDLNRSVELHEAQRLAEELAVARRRVLTDVNIAFLRALRAQRQIDVSRELVAIDQKALQVAEQLYQAMEVARTDVLRAEVEVENAQVVLRDAELRHIAAWRELQAVTGQTALPAAVLQGDLFAAAPEIDFDEALAVLQSQSPEIAAAYAAIERARCYLRRQQIEPRPNVNVDGLVNWRDNGINGDADMALTVAVPLPLWDKNRGAIQEARYQLVAATQQLEQLQRALASRLAPVLESYNSARQRVDSYESRIIPKAQETVELVRQTYELGEVSFDSLLQTQRTYTQTRLAYIDAVERLRVSEAEIDGLLLSGSLK